ncbi:MAG: 16S rRNA (uracil(1498)-N(3))-methyltransferase [Proteobacteria bacterium]|nr:16S rRNA (uracil(1498)-N(3))-methyltransferase [Pseudomonadota bacterium]
MKANKNLKRFHIDTNIITQERIMIQSREANHIKNVLRMTIGDHLCLFDNQGNEYEARITSLSSQGIEVEIIETFIAAPVEKSLQLCVAQSFLKDKKMDALVRQVTELGVTRWHPFFSERSIPQPDKNRMKNRLERWQKISHEALKQCRRNLPLEIVPPCTFDVILETGSQADLSLIFWENESMPLGGITADKTDHPQSVFIVTGPEGGFSQQEIDKAKDKGFICLSLGPRILKAETAAISSVTLMQFIFGDMK